MADFMASDPLGGSDVYLSDGTAYLHLAVRRSQNTLCVIGVLGGNVKWMHELKKIAVTFGYDWIGFRVRHGKWGAALAKYWKAKKVLSDSEGEEYFASMHAR